MTDKVSDRYLSEIGGATDEKMGLIDHLPRLAGSTLLEVGPGTGRALQYLLARIKTDLEPVNYPAIKVFDIFSDVLARLKAEITEDEIEIEYVCGDGAKQLPFSDCSIQGINVSSVVHECFSYGGGYRGIHNLARECGRILSLRGMVTYRDPEGLKLNNPVRAQFKSPISKLFMSFFLPKFLGREHSSLDSKIDLGYEKDLAIYLNGIKLSLKEFFKLDPNAIEFSDLFVDCASGLIHEIQRHFVLFLKTLKLGNVNPEEIEKTLKENHVIHVKDIEAKDEQQRQEVVNLLIRVGGTVMDGAIIATAKQINAVHSQIKKGGADIGNLDEKLLYILQWSLSEGEEHYFYGSCEETVARFALFSFAEDEGSALGYSCLCPMSLTHIMPVERVRYTGIIQEHIDRDDHKGQDRKSNVHFQKLPIEEAIKILAEYYTKNRHPALAEALRYFIEKIQLQIEAREDEERQIDFVSVSKLLDAVDELIKEPEFSDFDIEATCLDKQPDRIGIIGGVGSGKTTMANILRAHGYRVFTISDLIREEILRAGKAANKRGVFFQTANQMREDNGKDILARMCAEQIEESGASRFVIDGLRVAEEIEFLRRMFSDIVMIGMETPSEARIRRLQTRVKGLIDEQTRDEILSTMDRENFDPSPYGCRIDEVITLGDRYIQTNSDTSVEELESILRSNGLIVDK